MANQSWAQPSGRPPEWAVEDGARTTSSHSDPPESAAPQRHAIGEALTAIEESLDGVGTAQWQDVPEPQVRDLTRRIARLTARLSAHQMAAAQVMEKAGTARRAGATSTGQMMANDFGGDRRGSEDLVRTAGALEESGASATQDALAAGDISQEQAKIIGRTVAALPKYLTDQERREVEQKLLGAASRLSLTDLRRRGKRALEDVRPDPEADEGEDKETSRQEKSAWEKTCFSMWDRKDGTHGFNGIVPDLQAHQLRALLDAVVSPRRNHLADEQDSGADNEQDSGANDEQDWGADNEQDRSAGSQTGDAPPPTTPEEMTPYPNQLGRALCGLIEHFPTDGFAQAGGSPVSLAITFAYEHLANQSAKVAGTLTDGLRVSGGQIRRLACTQQLIPQVFNGRSVPLDQGTAKRLFTKEQRRILAQRDLGCAFPGCDRPPQWCDGHHLRSWSKGGRTDLGNGVLLCFFHHHAVHDQGWSVRLHPGDGIPEFAHPEHTGGRWQRNHRFRASTDLLPQLGAVP
ncbi:HNH endonuclease [Ornithinimicrobium sp. F0845]|uniref:HNH endonuclease signature motif containing protein n=1 Tax=Ornithinimicrobium sp. F0845 TaxID=2926412 RepID=UPI001FF37199|nr:HNH endonuclease signature motif containing protein [Ornithinimicrobium sp. F0845]MCK0112103.1 HNH endonuclease [Ornithinimicrobium sp. F0845]